MCVVVWKLDCEGVWVLVKRVEFVVMSDDDWVKIEDIEDKM